MRLAPSALLTAPALLGVLLAVGCGDGGSGPVIPTSISLSPNTVSFTAVGQTRQLETVITDERGDPVDGAAVAWQSSDEAVVTVSPTGLATAAGAGTAQVTATVGEIAAVAQVSVTQELANFEPVGGDAQAGSAGQPLPQPLVVEATDELGNPIPGLAVEFSVAQGGGSVQPAATSTGPDGRASTVFTLGLAECSAQQVDATVSGTDIRVSFTATTSGQAGCLVVVAGNAQTAPAGAAVPQRPAVRVLSAAGAPVAGVEVQFAVQSGGGSVTSALVATDAQGVATVGNWSLGASGVNTLAATVPAQSLTGEPALFVATVRPAAGFDIEIRHQGTPSAAQLLAFAEAEIRWESIITGNLADVPVNAAAGGCGPGSPALSEQVDDLLILADITAIDGPGAVLGAAGPCLIRNSDNLPAVGQMRFDLDDLEVLEANNVLGAVILHEMGHVLGIGTLWSLQNFLSEPSLSGGTDPHFTGPLAVAAFDAAGGVTYTGQKVPVEDTGGQGTADSHWRESVFGNEIMTGFVGLGANPISAVTIRSLEDQGYAVNAGAADPYAFIPSLRAGGAAGGFRLHQDVLTGPIYRIDQTGRVTGVARR
jgi:hypothetical protein